MRGDPLRIVYEALERAGCKPHGPQYKFISPCPGHDDTNASLSVGVGADGRALLFCHRGCETRDIVEALGLDWGDLFPAGHRHARPIRVLSRPRPALELVLAALSELHIGYRATRDPGMWVAEICPICRWSERWPLFIHEDERGRLTLSCSSNCDQVDILYRIVGAEDVAA
jgi:hypothetical protein